MSGNSAAPAPAISLPKGGGALRGIGEKFAPDLHTGTGNFTVPIELPPGRNGFAPTLNLVYSTGAGNGPHGLGWSVGIPEVRLKTSKRIPTYVDGQDVFLLSGSEDLVAVGSTGPVTRYRPRTEGLFAEITHHRDASDSHWEVRSMDGLVSFYGTPGVHGADPAVIADPARRRSVFAWKLTRTEDPFGNRIEYDYTRDSGETGSHRWDQIELSRIRYADHGKNRAHPEFLVSVEFVYGLRPDPFSDYRAGFEIRSRRRCTGIVVRTHAGSDVVARTYDFVYLDQRPELASTLPLNGVSLLSRIDVTGHDGARTERLPPIEFGYSSFDPRGRDFFPLQGADLPTASLTDPDLELVDLFGNGLPDLLETRGEIRYWRNLGGGRFDNPRFMRQAPAGLSLSSRGVQLVDANGDGRADLLVSNSTMSGYFPLDGDGAWDRRSFRPYRESPSFDLEDPEVRLVDLDGDGVVDAIRSGTRMECFFNDAAAGWTTTRQFERGPLDAFPNVSFSDPHVKWADMSGDGLQDIVLVHDGVIDYWPQLGHGRWGRRIRMTTCPRLPHGWDPRRLLLADVDGDGLADIVYVDNTQVTLWINGSGNGWSEPIVVRGTPGVSDADAVRVVDLLGSGIGGVLWSRATDGVARDRWFFLDFTGGVKPYLLDRMDNHIGAVTEVSHAPSTRFYLQDQLRSDTRWKTSLPFPVHVVASVSVIDHFSKGRLTTEYRYHDGHWDGGEREYRGFGMVEQFDSESFEKQSGVASRTEAFDPVDRQYFSAPTLSKTWFHLGPVGEASGDWRELDATHQFFAGDPPLLDATGAANRTLDARPATSDSRRVRRDALRTLRGSVLRSESYALDGSDREDRPYAVTESSYGLIEIDSPDDGNATRERIFLPHALASRTTHWERGDDPMTSFSHTRYTDDAGVFDPFGRPLSTTSIACPRGWRRMDDGPAAPYLAMRRRTLYAAPASPGPYLHGRVAKSTSFEIVNTAGKRVVNLMEIASWSTDLVLIGQTASFYDGAAFEGLPMGQVGAFGLVSRSEALVLTDDILQRAYGTALPPWLEPTGVPTWSAEYPPEFRSLLPVRAGYAFHPGSTDPLDPRGYFAVTQRLRHDVQMATPGRGLVLETLDPLHDAAVDALAHRTLVEYDDYQLLPRRITDAAGLTTEATYDYRVMQAKQVVDANGNVSIATFTPTGLLESLFVRGKTPTEGDQARPGLRIDYGLRAFDDSLPARRQPIFARTIRHIHHDTDLDVPLPERDETITSVEYSDGFGRLLQTRAQGEDVRFGDAEFGGGDSVLPALQSAGAGGDVVGRLNANAANPNVVVSGWQIHDNKGQVVEKYEPFFSEGWDYGKPTDAQTGQKVVMFYDPRGIAVRTVNPDGSEQRVVHGVPGRISAPDLSDPDHFEPSPWEAWTYDANDNAGRTHPVESAGYRHHWNTPASIVVDALGRTVESVQRNVDPPATPGAALGAIEEIRTRTAFDVRGNVLTITDAMGREAFHDHVYDLADRKLRAGSIDAGPQTAAIDAMNGIVEQRDAKGALILHAFDGLNRQLRQWARDAAHKAPTLRHRFEYGDGGHASQASAERSGNRSTNRLGKVTKTFDEAGLLACGAYDFKGNPFETTRTVLSDAAILTSFNPPPPGWVVEAFRVDWDSPAKTAMDPTPYTITVRYDALNRTVSTMYPEDIDGQRRRLIAAHDRTGALKGIALETNVGGAVVTDKFVENIVYNSSGQRVLIAYGNGLLTRYAHDARSRRLQRLRTSRYSRPLSLTYRTSGLPLQDLAYEYDLAQNVLSMQERTPDCGIAGSAIGGDRMDRKFAYDAIYRLRSANGRECDLPPDVPWGEKPRGVDLTKTREYVEHFAYDKAGNVRELEHRANAPGGFTRVLDLAVGTNRIDQVSVGNIVWLYQYDKNGNLKSETRSRHFEWDHADRMKAYATQTSASEPSVYAQYLYDAAGRRVKKILRKQGGQIESTVCIDDVFEHHRLGGTGTGGTVKENNAVHIMDDRRRVALVRVGAAFDVNAAPSVTYHLGDHLGSSAVVVDSLGTVFNREEYTPYGETSFGSFSRKRFRFTAKENDEESGLRYHGARYYLPWVCRWASSDPAGGVDGTNLYSYVRNNPLTLSDPSGMGGDDFGLTSPPGGADSPPNTTSTQPVGDRDASIPQPVVSASEVSNVIAIPEVTVAGKASSSQRSSGGSSGPGDLLAATVGLIWPQYVAPTMRARHPEGLNSGMAQMVQMNFKGAQGHLFLASDMTAVGAAGIVGGMSVGLAGPAAVAASEPIPQGALAAKGGLTVVATALYVNAGLHAAEITAGTVGAGSLGFVASSGRGAAYASRAAPAGAKLYNEMVNDLSTCVGKGGISDGFAQAAAATPKLMPAAFGKAFELRAGAILPNLERVLGGANQPDAVIRLGRQAINIDWTTLGQLAEHLERPYLQRAFIIFIHPGY